MATGALVAFTALSAGASIVKGIQTNSAMSEQGIAYMRQSQIARQESELAAVQKQREVDKFAASQVMSFAKNGVVTNAGSPLEVLHETIALGKQEVDAIRNQGIAQSQLYQANASSAFSSGRASLFGGTSDALTSMGSMFMAGSKFGLFNKKSTVDTSVRAVGVGDFSTSSYGATFA